MPTEFGLWLRRARIERGLSLVDLQTRTGINYTHISRMENGRSRPSRETVVRLAEAVNARTDEALLAAAFLPFDAKHLTDPSSSRIARRYYRLSPDLREIVDQAVALAERVAEERAKGSDDSRVAEHPHAHNDVSYNDIFSSASNDTLTRE